jgi:CheY-like chemotaxis protein
MNASPTPALAGGELKSLLSALTRTKGEKSTPETVPTPGSHGRPATHRVLVVDDNLDAALSLGELLRLNGHEVCVVFDGPEALQAAGEFRPRVVLLDIGLPGLDGYEVARRLRAQPAEASLLLVAVTAYGQPQDCARSREAGIDYHLTKPAEFAVIQQLLNAFGQEGARDGLRRR